MDLEPRPDPGRLRVSDAERQAVVEVLGSAASEGRLTLDEYSERAAKAYSAVTRADLVGLTDDLPTGTDVVPLPAASPVPRDELLRPENQLSALFGSDSLRGAFTMPALLQASAVFGDCQIELQDAHLAHPVTVIEAKAVFGSVVIYVPEGINVRMTGRAIFGSKTSKLTHRVSPGAPVLEVRTTVYFGDVTVRPPKKGWMDRLGLT